MAEGLKSTCVVGDVLGQHCNVSLAFPPSIFGNWLDKSDNLKTFLETYMKGGTVTGRSDNMSHSYEEPDLGTPVTLYATVDQKAIVIFKENKTGKQRRIEIPCPDPAIFEPQKGSDGGWRVKSEIGSAMADFLNNDMGLLSGLNISFKRGWLKSKQ